MCLIKHQSFNFFFIQTENVWGIIVRAPVSFEQNCIRKLVCQISSENLTSIRTDLPRVTSRKIFFFALCVKHQQRNWKCFMNLHDFSNVHSKKKFSGAYLAAEVLRPPPLTTLERNNRTNCITKEGKLRKYLQMKWTYSGVRVHRMHRQHNKESIVRLVCYVFFT